MLCPHTKFLPPSAPRTESASPAGSHRSGRTPSTNRSQTSDSDVNTAIRCECASGERCIDARQRRGDRIRLTTPSAAYPGERSFRNHIQNVKHPAISQKAAYHEGDDTCHVNQSDSWVFARSVRSRRVRPRRGASDAQHGRIRSALRGPASVAKFRRFQEPPMRVVLALVVLFAVAASSVARYRAVLLQ